MTTEQWVTTILVMIFQVPIMFIIVGWLLAKKSNFKGKVSRIFGILIGYCLASVWSYGGAWLINFDKTPYLALALGLLFILLLGIYVLFFNRMLRFTGIDQDNYSLMLTNSFKGSIALGMISEPAITVLNKFFQQSTSFKSTSAGIRMILRNCGNTGEIIITQTWSIFTLYIAVSLTLFFVGLFVATSNKK